MVARCYINMLGLAGFARMPRPAVNTTRSWKVSRSNAGHHHHHRYPPPMAQLEPVDELEPVDGTLGSSGSRPAGSQLSTSTPPLTSSGAANRDDSTIIEHAKTGMQTGTQTGW